MLAAVGYLPLLFFLPLFLARTDAFARHHAKQAMVIQCVLISFWVAVWVSDFVLGRVLGNMLLLGFLFRLMAWLIHYPLGFAVSLGYMVLAAVGLVQSFAGQYWRVPILGAFADRLAL